MIALDSQMLQRGSYCGPTEISHGEFFGLSRTQNGAAIGPDALSRALHHIDKLQPCSEEDTPTEHARKAAKTLLSEAQTIAPIYLMASTIEVSEGDLLI